MVEFKFELKFEIKFYAILEDNQLLIDNNRRAMKSMLGPHSGEAAQGPTGNLKHRTFLVSGSQSGPQQARSTQPVQLSAANLA